jgi:hypothetical protein
MDNEPTLLSEDFVPKENVKYKKGISLNVRINKDNNTLNTTNLSSPPQQENPSKATQCGLTFDPSPLRTLHLHQRRKRTPSL